MSPRVSARPRIVIAPDKFKGSCSARVAAEAIEAALRDVWHAEYTYVLVPLADGGDGTLEAFAGNGAVLVEAEAVDALDRPITARYARMPESAIIEMAAVSGLSMLGAERAPRRASTRGIGMLVKHALDHGVRRIAIGIGGSASTDGGAGALAELGVRFKDRNGSLLQPSPEGLKNLALIDASGLDERIRATTINIMCDVKNPLLGPTGAAAVYGPQKGAGPGDVVFLEEALRRLADAAVAATGRDLRDLEGAGAAGGLGWGLATFCGARLANGFQIIAGLHDVEAHVDGAVLCVTGEGRIDRQSLDGKVVGGVAAIAQRLGVELLAVGGSVDDSVGAPLRDASISVVRDGVTLGDAMSDSPRHIRDAVASWARRRTAP